MDIQNDVHIKNLDDLDRYMKNVRTDFRPAFAYVQQLQQNGTFKHLKGLLYFTDGYGQFPQAAPDFDTAFIFLDEGGEDVRIPPWAIKVVLNREELQQEAKMMQEDVQYEYTSGKARN